jgi:tetratricopeptide (TPR) repeat protein
LSYADKTSNDTLKKRINNNLGNIYCFEKKQYEKGINFYENSLKYSQKLADTNQVFMTKLNIAWAYFDSGFFEKGFPSLEFINKYNKKYGNETNAVAVNMLNGMYYSYKGNHNKATSSFVNAIKFGNEGVEKSDLSFSYLEYSKYLLKKGDYKNAYENLARYNIITDELYNEEKIKKANVAGINLELDEYKREIDKIETEKDAQLQSLRKRSLYLFAFFSFVIITHILVNFKKKNQCGAFKLI